MPAETEVWSEETFMHQKGPCLPSSGEIKEDTSPDLTQLFSSILKQANFCIL